MVVPLNFTLPSPNDLLTPMKAFNQGLSTLQNLYQTRMMPQMLQAEMQKNMLSGLPPLDAATMAYTNASRMLGEDHPTTQALKNNYQTMLQKETALANYQNVLAGAKDFSTLPTPYKLSVLAAGGRAPALGEGIGLVGGGAANSPLNGVDTIQNISASNLPQSPAQVNRLQQVLGGGSTLSPVDIGRLQNAGIVEQGVPAGVKPPVSNKTVQDIYQQQYSPQAQANIKTQQATQEQQSKTNIEGMSKLFQGDANSAGYNKAYDTANRSMAAINEFHDAYQQAKLKGAVKGYLANLDPDAQIALKNAANLLVSSVGAFKGMGRLNLNEFQTLGKGNLNIMLDPKAEEELYNQFKSSFATMQAQSQLAQKLRKYTNDPVTLQNIVNYAGDNYSVIDEKGKIHMENIPKMLKYATPEAVAAISSGKEYLPEDISDTGQTLDDFKNASLQSGIPMGQLIARYRKARGK